MVKGLIMPPGFSVYPKVDGRKAWKLHLYQGFHGTWMARFVFKLHFL